MAAGLHDVTIDQGARWSLAVSWQASDGTGINLTGYTISAQVRTTYADSGGDLLTDIEATITSAVNGEFTLSIPASTTLTMPAGSWRWDLEVDPGNGEVERLMMGKALVRAEVTR